ncbi:carbohydrate esterase family 12 protein [Patellaria atrata CBS 101060]|uniref:Carbohydrate esterase family 12 protein n=1 Tax=Patellaria atrata CBS 101060 TaxID=1346257 RepID=A0A9P4S427_9PEZI|nr:carbohydrate esterase family 12 protein [Patellaria atrata CBS 101060]
MVKSYIPLLASFSSSAIAATLYLAGDSTMARSSNPNMQVQALTAFKGWGEYLQYSMSIPVVNNAIGGRSARSFTREGRFDSIAKNVKSGDYVVIEFGHNDGGSLSNDNGRTDCPGTGNETCKTTYNGVQETVLTFPAYLQNAAKTYKSKGATVIISSQTPNNPWEGGKFTYGPNRFVTMAQLAAANAQTDYVDHGQYTANIFQTKGLATVSGYFPTDHTHTNGAGADAVAKAFVKGILCGNSSLKSFVKNSTESVEGACIGGGRKV